MDVRDVGAALAAGVLTSLLGQLQTPYHLLLDEFVVWTCGIGGLVHVGLSTWLAGRGARLGQLLGLGLTFGLGAAASHAVANSLVHHCAGTPGQLFFWSTWLPLVLFGSVAGHALGSRRPGWRWALVLPVVMGGVSLFHDLGQLLAGLEVLDPWVGLSKAYDQRADLSGRPGHLLERLWLVTLALTVLAASRNRRLLATGLGLGCLLTAGPVGLGTGGSKLYGQLSEQVEDEGVVLHYDPRSTPRSLAIRLAGRTAYRLQRYLDATGLPLSRPVDVRLFQDWEDLQALTGRSSAHAGYYWLNLTVDNAEGGTLSHELVHAVEPELGLWLPTLLNRGHIEGLATSWTNGMWELPEVHAELAAAQHAGVLPDPEVFMRLGGFVRVDEGNAYTASASFVGWLILEHGSPRYQALRSSHLDYQGTYGTDLAGLAAQWRSFLATVPVTAEDAATAWGRFSPSSNPGYASYRCPKVGNAVPDAEERALTAWQEGALLEAAERYEALAQAQPRYHEDAISALLRAGRYEAALDVLARWEAPEPMLDLWWSQRIEALMGLGRWEELERALDARAALGGESPARALLGGLLRDPETREATVAVVLPGTPRRNRMSALERLYDLRPDDVAVRSLWLREAFYAPWMGTDTAPQGTREAWDEALERARGTPGACEELQSDLSRSIATLLSLGELELGKHLLSEYEALCPGPEFRYAQRWYRDEVSFWEGR